MSEHLDEETIAGLAMLGPTDPERRAVEPHVQKCEMCRDALLSARHSLESAFDSIAVPTPPTLGALERTRRAVYDLIPAPPRLEAALFVIAVGVLSFSLPLLFSRTGSQIPWGTVLPGFALAGTLTAYALRRRAPASSPWPIAGALGISLGLALMEAGGGVHAPLLKCLMFELVIASAPLITTILLARRGFLRLDPLSLGSAAAFGAIAGQLALFATCPDHHLEHMVVAHTGGVLLAALLGLGAARLAVNGSNSRAR